MATLKETFRVVMTGSVVSPIKHMELSIQTYGKGAAEAMRIAQSVLDEAQGPTEGLAITEIERIES